MGWILPSQGNRDGLPQGQSGRVFVRWSWHVHFWITFEAFPSQWNHYEVDLGFVVCNSNCAVVGLVVPFAAMEEAFGPIDVVGVVMEQAL